MIPMSDYARDFAARMYARDSHRYHGLTNEEIVQEVGDELTALGAEENEIAAIALGVKALARDDCPPGDTARTNPAGRRYL
jgi:choline kinase